LRDAIVSYKTSCQSMRRDCDKEVLRAQEEASRLRVKVVRAREEDEAKTRTLNEVRAQAMWHQSECARLQAQLTDCRSAQRDMYSIQAQCEQEVLRWRLGAEESLTSAAEAISATDITQEREEKMGLQGKKMSPLDWGIRDRNCGWDDRRF